MKGTRAKARASHSVEILSGATLRLKQGRRYALAGRNGTGNSSEWTRARARAFNADLGAALLKALAEKLIPGIPDETRVAILQQTRLDDADDDADDDAGRGTAATSVLRYIIDRATARDTMEHEIQGTWMRSPSPPSFAPRSRPKFSPKP